MLKEFSVTNFKSIGKEQLFTMEACPKSEISEYEDHIINIGGQRLLKVASIYGPNGGGKTNLLQALFALKSFVNFKGMHLETIDDNSYMNCLMHPNEPTKFEIFFVNDEYELGYSITLDMSKLNDASKIVPNLIGVYSNYTKIIDFKIFEEEASFRKIGSNDFVKLYQRTKDGIVHSDLLSNLDIVSSKLPLNKNNTFIRYIAGTFAGRIPNDNTYMKLIMMIYDELNLITRIDGTPNMIVFTKEDAAALTPLLGKIKKCLNTIDITIDDIEFKKNKNNDKYSLMLTRKVNGSSFVIPLGYESSGTKKAIVNLMQMLSVDTEAVFIIDDLDSFLHPKIVRAFIELFNDESNTNKQIIFNSQDIVNMNNQVFRRDEIWFACKDKDYETNYIPLSSIVNYKGDQIRKDAKFGKQYLEGRYGADPYISRGLKWED